MRKNFYLKGLLSLLLMCVGLSAWGEEVVAYTLTPSAGTNNQYASNCDITIGDITWNVTGNASGTPWRIGGKNLSAVTREVYSKTAIADNITSITVTHGAASSVTVNSFTLTVASDADFSDVVSTLPGTFKAQGATTFTRPDDANWSNCYYKFSYNINISGNSNKYIEFSGAEFYKEAPAGTVSAPTLSVASGTYYEALGVHVSNYNANYMYAYTTDGSDPAFGDELNVTNGTEYDNESGMVISEDCTLKVIATDGDNTSQITSATYTIKTPEIFSSLEALVAADLTKGTMVKVSFTDAVISKIFTTQAGERKGVFLNVQKGGNDIEIFYAGVPTEWATGGKLTGVMVCPWTEYNGTWELAPASDSWSWNNLSYTAPSVAKKDATINMTYNNTLYEGKKDTYEVSYDGDGTLSVESSDTEIATVAIEGKNVTVTALKAGTATIKIKASETDEYNAANKSYTLTVKEAPKAATLPFTFDGGQAKIAETQGMSEKGISSTDYTVSPKLKFDGEGDYLIIFYNEAAKKVSFKAKGTKGTTPWEGAFELQESADGETYTTVKEYTDLTETATSYTETLKSDSRYVKFIYKTKTSGNVALGAIEIVAASAVEDPKLAFEKEKYSFMTTDAADDLVVKAASGVSSPGAITYSITECTPADAVTINATTGVLTVKGAAVCTVKAEIAAVEESNYSAGEATCQVTIKEPLTPNSLILASSNSGTYAMTNDYESGKAYLNSSGDLKAYEMVNKGGETIYYLDGDDDMITDVMKWTVTENEGKITIQKPSTTEYVVCKGKTNVILSQDAYSWNYDGTAISAEDTENHGTLFYNTSSPRFTTYTSNTYPKAQVVPLTNVTTSGVLIEANADTYFTYCEVSNITAHSATAIYSIAGKVLDENKIPVKLVLAEVTDWPEAATPYIFVSTRENIVYNCDNAPYTGEEKTVNGLVGNLENVENPQDLFIIEDNKVVKATTTILAGSSYIDLTKVSEYEGEVTEETIALDIVGASTSISSVSASTNAAPAYNVAGQRVNNNTKGIMLQNGRKFVNK